MSIRFSIVLPYFNEENYIEMTLESWLKQRYQPSELILIDNASKDNSTERCKQILENAPFPVHYLNENRPGKTNALECGCKQASGDWIAFSDADTQYPVHYLERAAELIHKLPTRQSVSVDSETVGTSPKNNHRIVALMAQAIFTHPDRESVRKEIREVVRLSRCRPRKAYTGNAGHILHRASLEECGGFTTSIWPLMYADHEIMHRLHRLGISHYDEELWCLSSDRRVDRSSVRWNLMERMLYRNIPSRFEAWFFYSFLRKRLEKRKMSILKLRERSW